MRSRFPAILRVLAAFLFTSLLLASAFPRLAAAGGTVTVGDLQPKEDSGSWKLKMTMNYGGTPPTAHIPMLFTFTQTVLYERSLTDQSPKTPTLTKKPLVNQPPIPESMDVGFSDPTGKIFTTTKFDFVIKRDHGFEAGEYTLVIKRSNDGVQMGQTIHLTLQGENEVVDRRAIVFTGEKKDKDKKDNAAASPDEKKDEPAAGQGDTSGGSGDGAEGSGGGAPVESPPANPPKQGGCGCRLAEPAGNSGLSIAALVALSLLAWRRRRH